ncbi:hypothetical protein DFQ04_3057 [Algoriphagus boseongensis]|uniref:Galactose oxidase-like protein n=1 Tax=Algoriphagus boseongensis TaxID=1442587 RepID=A0A4R6T3T6_9BACT|nr:hypothetical protein [Algoriphagus boseongensis]TDQ15171.1 hypothetical protein DFQ04_3057 [Algoriphagus boseongensis]
MRKLVSLGLLWAFFACEQEEFITQRDYPFVESVGISDLNETGVTVNFEILKSGNSSIDAYGLEFIEARKLTNGSSGEFEKIIESKAPSENVISIRIAYDLIDKEEYVVRPFVSSGGRIVYGENLVFLSQGVQTPKITEVTPKEFYLNSTIEVKGDYFNSRLENNSIEVINSEEYRIYLDSVFRDRIKFRIEVKSSARPIENQKLLLKLTSGGKVVQFPSEITSIVPKITLINPREFYVGDKIQVQFSYPIDLRFYDFRLNTDQFNGYSVSYLGNINPNTAEFSIPQIPAGEYFPSLSGTFFPQEYPELKIKVLPSWEVYRNGIQGPKWNETRNIPIRNQLLLIGRGDSDQGSIKLLSLGSSNPENLPLPPTSNFLRTSNLTQSDGDKFLYYGLGFNYIPGSTESYRDFFRLDIQTKQWKKLADFPFDFTSVSNSFFYQGKLYVVLWNYLNFRVYDPITDQWSLSAIQVPNLLKSGSNYIEKNGALYFLSSSEPNQILRYVPGGQVGVFTQLDYSQNGVNQLYLYKNFFLSFYNGNPISRISYETKEIYRMQQVFESPFSDFLPWQTSDGFYLAFPISRNSYVQENKIYRLIQDF